jgi:hypothetical protein
MYSRDEIRKQRAQGREVDISDACEPAILDKI